jgi:hypothetical protein
MQGIPKILQARADFDMRSISPAAARAGRAAVARHFRGLIEAAHHYVFDRVLADARARWRRSRILGDRSQ